MSTNNPAVIDDPDQKLAELFEKETGVTIPAVTLAKFMTEHWEMAAFLAHAFRRQNKSEAAS